VIGVETLTVDGATIRTIAKTTADGQVGVQRDLRRALTEALETSGLSQKIAASRMLPRPASPYSSTVSERGGEPGGAT
jgi:small conductance mechanosensitive channel